jgi:hypothetical protein
MSAVIFSGPKVKTLKKALTLNEAGEEFFTVFGEDGVDPRSSGVAAPEGSLLVDKSNGKWFKKVGPGDTAWVYMQEEPEEDNEYLDYESSNFSTRDGVASIGSWTSSDTDKITITTTATDPFFGSHSGLITKLAVDAVNAYLPVASAVIPRGNRGKPIIIKMSADFTHANYVSDNLEFQLWDITGTPTQIYVSGDVKIKKAKGDIILVGYPEATCSQVELRAVIATDSATSSSWTGKIDRVQLGPDKLVPSLFFRTEEIDLAGDFTAGTIRVSRVGSQVTISVVQAITVSPAKWNPATATGFIPTWARPTDHATNVVGLGSAAIARVRVDNNGEFKFEQRSIADGSTVNLTTVSGSVISYTVPDTESPLISTTEALFKVIRARVRQFSQNVTTSNATMIPTLKDYDTVGSFNMTTGIFKVPRSGKLKVNAHFRGNVASTSATNTSVSVSLFKNATLVTRFIAYRYVVTSTNLNPSGSGRIEIDVQSGDEIDVRINRQSQISSFDLDGTDEGFIEFEMAPDLSVYGIGAIDKLNHIGDVEITAPTDGLALVYDGVSNTWKADQVPADGLASNSVTTVKISDLAVTSAKLATGDAERDWVLARTSDASAGAVGTYAFLGLSTDNTNTFGSTRAGSQLHAAGFTSDGDWSNSSPSGTGVWVKARGNSTSRTGTWRCMGVIGSTGGYPYGASLWLRIS